MYLLANALMKELNKYQEILIWGSGQCGKEVYNLICQAGLKKRIKNFVVTSMEINEEIEGIQIISVKELTSIDNECVLLIAVINPQYVEEIQQEVNKRQYHNVIMLSDYYINNYCIPIKDERQLLREESFDKMLTYMTETYLYLHKDEALKYIDVKNYLLRLASERECIEKKKIVFIVGTIYVRTPKIAVALKKKGYIIKMIQMQVNSNQYAGENLLIENGIEICKCQSISELLYKALEEKPLVYYIDPPWLDSSLAMFMIHNKKKYGKIIFGEYDVQRVGQYYTHPEYYYLTEQYALENADGVVWRYDAKDYMERELGYHYKGKSIQFYDYCNNCTWQEEADKDDKTLKMCFLPSHLHDIMHDEKIDKKYVHTTDIYELLELIGNRSDCILDIYVWAYYEKDLQVCKKIEQNYFNVKFYFQVPNTELIKKMQRYDYGLELFKSGKNGLFSDIHAFNFISKATSCYAASNKYFDYLGAGLPIVATFPKKQIDYLEQFGVVVKMDADNFDIEFLKRNKAYYRQKVKEALPFLLVDCQIGRLIDFIEDVAND